MNPTQPVEDRRAGRRLAAALGLAALWALLYLPHLGTPELDDEEGRRFLPARAMLTGGELVQPTIFERPYLSKPPLHYWAIAALSKPRGVVTTWTLRLPSALAVLGVALALLWLCGPRLPGPAGELAAAVWLVTPLTLEKGLLGELEAPLTLFVTLSIGALFVALERRESGRRAAVPLVFGGLALGAAVLTKGPAAWVFLGAATVGAIALDRRRIGAAVGSSVAMLAISALIGGAWVWLLARDIGWDELQARWGHELVGGERTLGDYLGERVTYVQRAFAGLLPGSALALVALRRRRATPLPRLVAFALITLAAGALFFLIWSRSRSRYLFPAAPMAAIVGGWVLAGGLAAGRARAEARAVRWTAGVLGAVGIALGAALFLDGAVWDFAPTAPGGFGLALAALTAAVGLAALRGARADRRPLALAAALGVALGARLIHATQVLAIEPAERAPLALEIEAGLPPDGPLHTAFWGEFNLMAYLPRRVVWTEEPAALPAGAALLYAIRGDESAPPGVEDWPHLGSFPVEKGRTLHIVRAP